jgi:hypothetical protein
MIQKLILLTTLIVCLGTTSNGQDIKPYISARVDTSKAEVNEIYHLNKNYINARPDSCYKNPYWSEKEYPYYLEQNRIPIDRSANAMFGQYFKTFIKEYKPTVLQIDSLDSNLYQIKTMFKSNDLDADSLGYAISYITNLYASKNEEGIFKLANTISKRTKDWRQVNYKFITYVISPNYNFKEEEAKKAVDFCEKISKMFELEILPFKYYVLSNSDEFGKLLNFEYWTYYFGAQTNLPLREIFTSYSNEHFPHEFVHMMFPLRKSKENTPNIISEGLATWLGGPTRNVSYQQALSMVSETLKTYQNPTFKDITSFKVRNKFDSNIFYVTGAVLCELIYEKQGEKGIMKVYYSKKETLDSVLEEIFEMPIKETEERVMHQIINYPK